MFRPDRAYELVVQWVASSGSIVADMVKPIFYLIFFYFKFLLNFKTIKFVLQISVWQRKAQACGIQIIPIPSDLLALPFTLKSDSLRGPIFIRLNIECLTQNKQFLFEGIFCKILMQFFYKLNLRCKILKF